MKIHILGLPHTETTAEFSACAFTQRARDFASMMTDAGYDVRLYAGEHNDARCTEHVPVVTRAQQKAWWPDFDRTKLFNDFNSESLPWRVFNLKASDAIRERASKGDILAITGGLAHKAAALALPELFHVETAIGYAGVWAPYRVFDSMAWRHYLAAKEQTDNLRWFDEVIYRGYFMNDFPLGNGGHDFLYIGRLISRKGPTIAAETCRKIGARLLVAGQGMKEYKAGEYLLCEDGTRLECNVRYLGVLSPEERAVALGSVRAVFMPTWYLEPGGGVAIEAQLCGTPVITTPYGAMSETVINGVTGYHCSSFAEFVKATDDVELLDRSKIRKSARERFSAPVIASQYSKYFKKLQTLYGEGWYAI